MVIAIASISRFNLLFPTMFGDSDFEGFVSHYPQKRTSLSMSDCPAEKIANLLMIEIAKAESQLFIFIPSVDDVHLGIQRD